MSLQEEGFFKVKFSGETPRSIDRGTVAGSLNMESGPRHWVRPGFRVYGVPGSLGSGGGASRPRGSPAISRQLMELEMQYSLLPAETW